MAPCCNNPHNVRLEKTNDSYERINTGNIPPLVREEMTSVIDPAFVLPAAPVPGTPILKPDMPDTIPEGDGNLFPDAPSFQVPANPLLPPGYNEVLTYDSLQYLNGFYRTQIGRYVRVEQQINSTDVEIRYGYLIGVGINYLLLQDATSGNVYTIDSYSIKLFYVYYNIENPFTTLPGL